MFYKLLCLMTVFVLFFFMNLNKVYAAACVPADCTLAVGCGQSCNFSSCNKVGSSTITISSISKDFWISNSPDCITHKYGPFETIPYKYIVPFSPAGDGSLYITNLPATIVLSDITAEHYACQPSEKVSGCCPWTTGAYGACVGGFETRTVSCLAPNGDCCGAAPSTTQACACGPYLACCPPGSWPDWGMKDGKCQPSCGYALVHLSGKNDINAGCDSYWNCYSWYFYTAGTHDCNTCCENDATVRILPFPPLPPGVP